MREQKIKIEDGISLICESLDGGQNVIFSPRGASMLPTIKEGRDKVTLSPAPEKLKRGDIAFYKRRDGQYVLHRVVRVRGGYVFCGDGQFSLERGIEKEQIIAICSHINRGGKDINSGSLSWKIFAARAGVVRLLRRVYHGLRHRIAKIVKK